MERPRVGCCIGWSQCGHVMVIVQSKDLGVKSTLRNGLKQWKSGWRWETFLIILAQLSVAEKCHRAQARVIDVPDAVQFRL